MKPETKYLTEKEQIRLKLLADEIYMLSRRAQRILKKRDSLRKEVGRIHESATKIKTT